MAALTTDQKDAVLASVVEQLHTRREEIKAANQQDLDAFADGADGAMYDRAMYDRLVCDDHKIDGMIRAVEEVAAQPDPVGRTISEVLRPNGLRIVNRTAAFGTVMIIYESRPDVTVEAAVVAFKAGSKILLKGGKEAVHSNRVLVNCWAEALRQNGLSPNYVRLLELDRSETQAFLRQPPDKVDLIVPRGGEGLIRFVKAHATCAVLVSGRGNNFLYVHPTADWDKTLAVVLNAKTSKISACNALDKVLIDRALPQYTARVQVLAKALAAAGVEVWVDESIGGEVPLPQKRISPAIWAEEFLAMEVVIGAVADATDAIELINRYAGGHSATIMCEDAAAAEHFMEGVDCAAVYLNASTRFTDGGEMGVGAELAISTDKLHHRGPLGLAQLVTNKYWVYGAGQVRG